MIKITNLSKSFHNRVALKSLSFSLPSGEKVALLGPNGAGKSTLISLLCGFRRASSGNIHILDLPVGHPELKSQVGFCLQESEFPSYSRVSEVMNWVAKHYPEPLKKEELAEAFSLKHLLDRQTGGLSGGERRRLGLALAFLGRPQVVILDEPTTAVDLENRHRFYDFATDYISREKATLFFSTHQMDEAERLGDRLIILHQGQLLAESTPQDMRSLLRSRSVRLRCSRDLEALDASWTRERDSFYSCYDPAPERLLKKLFEEQIEFSQLEVSPPSIEEAFMHLTEKGQ